MFGEQNVRKDKGKAPAHPRNDSEQGLPLKQEFADMDVDKEIDDDDLELDVLGMHSMITPPTSSDAVSTAGINVALDEREKRKLPAQTLAHTQSQSMGEKKVKIETEGPDADAGGAYTSATTSRPDTPDPFESDITPNEDEINADLEYLIESYNTTGGPPPERDAIFQKIGLFVEKQSTVEAMYKPWEEGEEMEDMITAQEPKFAEYFTTRKLWSKKLEKPPMSLVIGNFAWRFRLDLSKHPWMYDPQEDDKPPTFTVQSRAHIVVAGSDGRLMMLREDEDDFLCDTKADCLTAMIPLKMFRHTPMDIIVGDTCGLAKIVTEQQVLVTEELGAEVTCLVGVTNIVNRTYIVAGDAEGIITAFDWTERLWRVRIGGIKTSPNHSSYWDPGIKAMLSVRRYDPTGLLNSILLVCDGAPHVHVMYADKRAMTLGVPCPITSMCQGYFKKRVKPSNYDALPENERVPLGREQPQIILASTEGDLIIVDDWFNRKRYLQLDFCITKIKSFRLPSQSAEDTDYLAVVGHFCEMRVYKDAELVYIREIQDWVHDFDFFPHDGTEKGEDLDSLQIGMCFLDGQVEHWKFTKRKST